MPQPEAVLLLLTGPSHAPRRRGPSVVVAGQCSYDVLCLVRGGHWWCYEGGKRIKKESFIYLFYSNSLTASFQGGVVAHNRLLTVQCKQLKCIPQI